jgi:hypothetical protein
MSEFPNINKNLGRDRITNIILNAIENNCFNDDNNTMEVIIYDNTILASPIPDVESLSECDHDFIGLGERSMINGQDMGYQVFIDYRDFLNPTNDVKIEKDDVTLENAFKYLHSTMSSLVAVDDDISNRQLLSSLLGNQSQYPGTHFPPNDQFTSPNVKTSLAGLDNSVSASKFSVRRSPNDLYPSPTLLSPNGNSQDSHETTLSEYQTKLDQTSHSNSRLKSHLHTNEGVNKSTVNDSSSSERCNEIFGKVSKQTKLPTQPTTSASIDHGCLNLNTSIDIFDQFNKIYDKGSGIGKTFEKKAVQVDPKLLNLSYVYYSRNSNSGNIRGILICLEKDGSSEVFMKKYLFSCDSTMQSLTLGADVSGIAPNVARLCSEMQNRKIDGVDVALMKAAADRTLKIGALLFAVGLENEKRCFVTHDVKNFQYNKVKKILQKDKTLKNVPLFSVLTTQHSRGKQGGEPRRYILVHQPQLQDPELQKLINDKFILTNSCEELELEIENLEDTKKKIDGLLVDIEKSINQYTPRKTPTTYSSRILQIQVTKEYKEFVEKFRRSTGNLNFETDFETTINKLFNPEIQMIKEKKEKIYSNIHGQIMILHKLISDYNKDLIKNIEERTSRLETCRNNIERIKQQIKEQQILSRPNLSPYKQTSEKGGKEKGGKEIGGRRTKRSIKVITKRKIKVKSKTIKKKSRRRNKTRRQRKKL